MTMNPRYLCFLVLLLKYVDARIITIEEFGGLSDSEIPTVKKEPIFHPEFLHSSNKADGPQNLKHLRARHSHIKTQDDEVLIEQAVTNTQAYNIALLSATEGDTILLPENQSYTFMGGIKGVYLKNITLDFAAYTRFLYDRDRWPVRAWSGAWTDNMKQEFSPAIDLTDCIGIVITSSATNKAIVSVDYTKNEIYMDPESGSGGIIDGHGKKWWNDAILGEIEVESRPRLVDIRSSMDITVEYLTLVNSPYWTLTLEAIGAEVHHVNVLVDRNYQRQLVNNTLADADLPTTTRENVDQEQFGLEKAEVEYKRNLRQSQSIQPKQLGKIHFPDIPDWILQPQNLNTDGIDPVGQNIYIHDCIVLNDDDSVAVKPPIHGQKGSVLNHTIPYDCTSNITIENMVLTGFGASIGSVGPLPSHPCIDNVRFKNINMPGTGKGIYIKSNKSDCKKGVSSSITNIVYDNIYIKQPVWWPIWIGPQQQHEPHQSLGGACSLDYPLDSTVCPTQGCTTFENITLKNIYIEDPLLSPGVILGNSTNPMKNLIFNNVTMNVPMKDYLTHGRLPFHNKRFPFSGKFQCEHIVGTCEDCNPVPDCLETI